MNFQKLFYAAVKQVFLIAACFLALSGCGEKKPPFEYQFHSKDEVSIDYLGKTYRINRFIKPDNLPFEYQFENDGDVDIVINGKSYDLDSPFDRDTKALKKKTSKRKSSRRSSRRR